MHSARERAVGHGLAGRMQLDGPRSFLSTIAANPTVPKVAVVARTVIANRVR